MTYDEIKSAWNSQASETNQWDDLGEDEKIEWAASIAVARIRAQEAQQESDHFELTASMQPNAELCGGPSGPSERAPG